MNRTPLIRSNHGGVRIMVVGNYLLICRSREIKEIFELREVEL